MSGSADGLDADDIVENLYASNLAASRGDITADEYEAHIVASVGTRGRRFGQLPNISVPADFDDPLPDAEVVAWEGKPRDRPRGSGSGWRPPLRHSDKYEVCRRAAEHQGQKGFRHYRIAAEAVVRVRHCQLIAASATNSDGEVLSARGLRAEVAAGEAHRHAGLIRRHAGLAGYRAGGALHALSGVERAARLQTGLQNSVIVAGETGGARLVDVSLLVRCDRGRPGRCGSGGESH
jgi:hypothetical protein